MMITNVRGGFSSVKGTVVIDSDDPSASTVEATIDVSSIATLDTQRDTHLKSADFLDAEHYPTITFKSKKVEKAGDDEYKLTGDLTIHGLRGGQGSVGELPQRGRSNHENQAERFWPDVERGARDRRHHGRRRIEARDRRPDDQGRCDYGCVEVAEKGDRHRQSPFQQLSMNSSTEYVNIVVADGTEMRAFVARPAGAPKAGLIVFQEAFGVNPHIRDVAERFAREGYLAIAPELFHRTAPGLEAGYGDLAPVAPHMKAITDPGLEADTRAAYDWLKSEGRVASVSAVGYCMGGRCAALASIILPLGCGISYYGGGIAPSQFFPALLDRLKDLQAPMLFFWGGQDHHIGPDRVLEVNTALRAAGKHFVNVEFSFADHGFFCDARPSYSPEAASEAWPITMAFLGQHSR
jgi:carboxymethylenebutenolidase